MDIGFGFLMQNSKNGTCVENIIGSQIWATWKLG